MSGVIPIFLDLSLFDLVWRGSLESVSTRRINPFSRRVFGRSVNCFFCLLLLLSEEISFRSELGWVLGLGFWLSSAGGGQGEEEEEDGWVGRAVVRSVMNGSQAQQERGWCVCWKTYFVGVGFSEKSLYPFVIYCRSCCKKKKKKKIAARRNWHGMNTMGCS